MSAKAENEKGHHAGGFPSLDSHLRLLFNASVEQPRWLQAEAGLGDITAQFIQVPKAQWNQGQLIVNQTPVLN